MSSSVCSLPGVTVIAPEAGVLSQGSLHLLAGYTTDKSGGVLCCPQPSAAPRSRAVQQTSEGGLGGAHQGLWRLFHPTHPPPQDSVPCLLPTGISPASSWQPPAPTRLHLFPCCPLRHSGFHTFVCSVLSAPFQPFLRRCSASRAGCPGPGAKVMPGFRPWLLHCWVAISKGLDLSAKMLA